MYTLVTISDQSIRTLRVDGVFRGSGSETVMQVREFNEFSDAAITAREIRDTGGPTVLIQEEVRP